MVISAGIGQTNAIESLNMTLRKVIKNKRVFPSDESVFKLLYLAIDRIARKWAMPIHHWKPAMNRFMIESNYSVMGRAKVAIYTKLRTNSFMAFKMITIICLW
jgi:putative transposase